MNASTVSVARARRVAFASLFGIVMLLAFRSAVAAPCAGFTDVDDTSSFCTNVEWLKNRRITLGCTSATLYCPTDTVSRLAMAAFMNRLGTALTPVHVPLDVAPGAIDLDLNAVVCQTADLAVVDFPRRAYVDLSFAASATADVGFAAELVMSVDAGTTWTALNTAVSRGSVRANQWGNLGDVAFADLAVGQNVRFGTRVGRGGLPGSAQLSNSRCALRVLIHNRNA